MEAFKETSGKGIEGNYEGLVIKLGSENWINGNDKQKEFSTKTSSLAHLAINNQYLGYFEISNNYREGIEETIKKLTQNYDTFLP